MTWEKILERTFRMRVPGGWLYRYDDGFEGAVACAMCFVPYTAVDADPMFDPAIEDDDSP